MRRKKEKQIAATMIRRQRKFCILHPFGSLRIMFIGAQFISFLKFYISISKIVYFTKRSIKCWSVKKRTGYKYKLKITVNSSS